MSQRKQLPRTIQTFDSFQMFIHLTLKIAYHFHFFSAIMSVIYLDEKLNFTATAGIILCLIGSIIIVLHAPSNNTTQTLPAFFAYVLSPGAIGRKLYVETNSNCSVRVLGICLFLCVAIGLLGLPLGS